MKQLPPRSGFVLLITVLIVGAIGTAILSSLLLLGISANKVSLSVQESAQALGAAQACAEYALLQLRESPNYTGSESLSLDGHACDIHLINGAGNTNRSICVEGRAGDSYRRLEIVVDTILPVTKVFSWQEVPLFLLCT